MPLYKITSKKLARKEEEDESGLTKLKELLGVGDEGSGSDESESESGSEGESEGSSGSGSGSDTDGESSAKGKGKRKRLEEDEDDDDDDVGEDEEESGEDDSDDEEDDDFDVSLEDAPSHPLYASPSLDCPDAQHCIFCPGKVLKNGKMADVHLKSGRSLRRYTNRLAIHLSGEQPLPTDDPREVVSLLASQSSTTVTGPRLGKGAKKAMREKTRGELAKEEQRAAAKAKRKERKVLKKAKREERKEARRARVTRKLAKRESKPEAESTAQHGEDAKQEVKAASKGSAIGAAEQTRPKTKRKPES